MMEIDLSFYTVEELNRAQIAAIVGRLWQSSAESSLEFVTFNLRHNDLHDDDGGGSGGDVSIQMELTDEDRLRVERRSMFLSLLTEILSSREDSNRETPIHRLVLSHNKLSSIPSKDLLSLIGPHLICFEMSHGCLQNLSTMLSRLADSLHNGDTPSRMQLLDLSFNRLGAEQTLTTRHVNLLAPFAHLREIYLQGNNLTLGNVEQLEFGASVEVIDLSQNRISGVLPPRMFQNIAQLRELYLADNQISELPSLLFERAYKTLKLLHVNSNCIKTLQLPVCAPAEEGRDSKACALLDFDISCNELEMLPDNIFTLFDHLHTLRLHSNRLTSLPGEGLSGLREHLTNFTIHNNQIESLPTEILDLHKVEFLYWQQNKLKMLPGGEEFGERASHVQELDLSDNELEVLPASVGQMNKLIKLILDNNKLRTLPNDIANLDLMLLSVHDNPDLKLSPLLQRTVQSRI